MSELFASGSDFLMDPGGQCVSLGVLLLHPHELLCELADAFHACSKFVGSDRHAKNTILANSAVPFAQQLDNRRYDAWSFSGAARTGKWTANSR